MDYKNFSADEMVWNKTPIQLLKGLPHPAGPALQPPVPKHLRQLANTRAGVFKNFKLNTLIPGIFSKDDERKIYGMFDNFCEVVQDEEEPELRIDRLQQIMAAEYKFTQLPTLHVAVELGSRSCQHVRPAVEPIMHSKFTESQRNKALAASQAATLRAAEMEAAVEDIAGAALERGTRHLSSKASVALQKYQTLLNAAVHGRQTNAKPVYVAEHVGGAKHPTQGMMFLLAFPNKKNAGGSSYKWVLKVAANWEGIEDKLLKEKVTTCELQLAS